MGASNPDYHEPEGASDAGLTPPARGSRYLDQNKLDWKHAGTDSDEGAVVLLIYSRAAP